MQTLSVVTSEQPAGHRPPGAMPAYAELLSKEPDAAILEAISWLDELPEGLTLPNRLEQLLQFEEIVRPQARRLGNGYLTSPRLGRRQEYHLWQLNNDYWTRLVNAYEYCLDRYAAGEPGADSLDVAMLYARLLHAYVACHKWARFRYAPIGGRLWAGSGQAYLGAVDAGLSGNSLSLFPGAAGNTSTEREYLKLLMLHASSTDNLLPLEVEIALRLINNFLPHFTFTDELRHGNVFWVDAAGPLPPTRLAKRPESSPTLRFFSAGKALKAVAELRRRIEEAGEVPAEVGIGRHCSAASVVSVLDHLALCWGTMPPARSAPRHPVNSRLVVINGLAEIKLRLAGNGEMPGGTSEHWVAENVSRDGLGAKRPLEGSDWIRIGALVGIQPEGGDNWLVGVIRRFTRESETLSHVGIETVGKAPRLIVAAGSGVSSEATLLDTPHLGDTVSLVLAHGAFDETVPITFELDGVKMRLQPLALAETGTDFVRGSYRVEAPEASDARPNAGPGPEGAAK